jgi:hypothetical protein
MLAIIQYAIAIGQIYLLWRILGVLRDINRTNEYRKEVSNMLKGLKEIQIGK